MNLDFMYGALNLSFWGYVIVTLVMWQITIIGVTLYLHRDQAHRSLNLHPGLRHFFRFWLWSTSGMLTPEWVAVHRKHHARCETAEDPHSPVIFGLKKVLLEGAELYQVHARDPEVVEKYGRGTPTDWLERNLYSKHRNWGIILLVLTDLLLFGAPGIIIIAVQLISMPLFAAGVINGLGHHTGYRNYECPDAATNIVPWGIIVGGEELHNNHHAFPSSAKFSSRPWEFDIGWFWIKVFSAVGLAEVVRVAPAPIKVERKHIDLETVRALIVNRMHVLRAYTRHVTLPVFRGEVSAAGDKLSRRIRKLLVRQPTLLDAQAHSELNAVLATNSSLKTVHDFRERLQVLWSGGSNMTNEKLLQHLKEWVAHAEESGIKVLQDFAATLRGYSVANA